MSTSFQGQFIDKKLLPRSKTDVPRRSKQLGHMTDLELIQEDDENFSTVSEKEQRKLDASQAKGGKKGTKPKVVIHIPRNSNQFRFDGKAKDSARWFKGSGISHTVCLMCNREIIEEKDMASHPTRVPSTETTLAVGHALVTFKLIIRAYRKEKLEAERRKYEQIEKEDGITIGKGVDSFKQLPPEIRPTQNGNSSSNTGYGTGMGKKTMTTFDYAALVYDGRREKDDDLTTEPVHTDQFERWHWHGKSYPSIGIYNDTDVHSVFYKPAPLIKTTVKTVKKDSARVHIPKARPKTADKAKGSLPFPDCSLAKIVSEEKKPTLNTYRHVKAKVNSTMKSSTGRRRRTSSGASEFGGARKAKLVFADEHPKEKGAFSLVIKQPIVGSPPSDSFLVMGQVPQSGTHVFTDRSDYRNVTQSDPQVTSAIPGSATQHGNAHWAQNMWSSDPSKPTDERVRSNSGVAIGTDFSESDEDEYEVIYGDSDEDDDPLLNPTQGLVSFRQEKARGESIRPQSAGDHVWMQHKQTQSVSMQPRSATSLGYTADGSKSHSHDLCPSPATFHQNVHGSPSVSSSAPKTRRSTESHRNDLRNDSWIERQLERQEKLEDHLQRTRASQTRPTSRSIQRTAQSRGTNEVDVSMEDDAELDALQKLISNAISTISQASGEENSLQPLASNEETDSIRPKARQLFPKPSQVVRPSKPKRRKTQFGKACELLDKGNDEDIPALLLKLIPTLSVASYNDQKTNPIFLSRTAPFCMDCNKKLIEQGE